MVLSILAVCIYLILGLIIFKLDKRYFWYIAIFYFFQLWTIISGAYIETGVYISEQMVTSFRTDSTIRLVLYNVVFLVSFIIFAKIISRPDNLDYKLHRLSREIVWAILAGILITTLLLYLNVVVSGVPLFSGHKINKFNFWQDYAVFPSLERFAAYAAYYGFTLGYIYRFQHENRLYKKVTVGLLIFYIGYQVIAGNKFSQPLVTMSSFLIPFISLKVPKSYALLSSRLQKKLITRVILSLLIAVILVLGLSVYDEAVRGGGGLSSVMYRIFGLQGHVWWGTDLLVQTRSIDYFGHFVAEVQGILYPVTNPINTGIHFLTILVGGGIGYDAIVNKGVSYTMGYPAITLYAFGPLGAIFAQVIFGSVMAIIAVALHVNIKAGNLIRSLLIFRLLSEGYTTFTMGTLDELFNIKSVIIIIILICSYLISLRSLQLINRIPIFIKDIKCKIENRSNINV